MAPLLVETAKAHKRPETGAGWEGDRAQVSLVEEEERRTAPRASRAEQTLPRNLEKTESAEAGQTFDQDQGECRDGKGPRKHKAIAKQENPETFLMSFFQDLHSIHADQLDLAQAERTHWTELWKNLRMDRASGTLISTEKWIAFGLSGKNDVLFHGDGSESGGCYVLIQVRADRWFVCAAKNPGLCVGQVAPSTAVRECADGVCAEDARRCWFVFAAERGRVVSRMAERNCGGAAGREEGVRPCGSRR